MATAQSPAVAVRMAEHFASAAAMRDALMRGDLERLRASAATLSDRDLSANVSDAWKPHLEAMRVAAKGARDAASLEAGAQALTEVAQACAVCHEKLGTPKLAVGDPPPGGSGALPPMIRHAWAADRLWEGLAIPSQEAWAKGAEVFTEAPLEPAAVAGPKSVSPEVGELAKRAHAYGMQARAATDRKARAKVLADVYATCVGCHTQLGVGKAK